MGKILLALLFVLSLQSLSLAAPPSPWGNCQSGLAGYCLDFDFDGTDDVRINAIGNDFIIYDGSHPSGLSISDLYSGSAGVDWTQDQSPDQIHVNNLPVGTLSTEVAQGDHAHDGRYYTETESDNTFLADTTYDAQTVIVAVSDNTPTALTISEQTVLGRITGGNITALTLGNAPGNVAQWPSDPAAHTLFGFDNTSNTYIPITIGTGLSFDQPTSTLSSDALSNPMTTAGDIIYGGASGVPTRLAKGSNNSIFGINAAGTIGWYTNYSSDDSNYQFYDSVDDTKRLQFELGSITTGNTRVVTVRDSDGTMAYTTDLDTWAEHPTLTAANILVGNASNEAASVAMSGDVGIDNAGATTIQADAVDDTMIDWGTGANQVSIADLSGSQISGALAWDFGGVTTFEGWNSTSDMTLTAAGQFGFQVTDDQFVFHGGAAGEIQGEAAKYLGEKLTLVFDPSDAYDQESTYRVLPLPPLGDDAPEGITITEWNLNYVGGDPTTELDADLMCDTTPDYNPAAGATVMDVLDTTAGASNADTGFDSATCANGSNMYIRFGADPTDANVMIEFTLWYYAEED